MKSPRTAIPVSSDQASADLSKRFHPASTGQTIIITEDGCALARPAPAGQFHGKRIGSMRGKPVIPHDLDAPLPDELLNAFEAGL